MTPEQTTPFTILRGGLSETARDRRKVFLSASVTDTRLMGVTGLTIHWLLPENETLTHFHQFFYFDAEEFGFDTYKSVLTGEDGQGIDELQDTENSLLGGLGGKQVAVTEKEAVYMVQEYVSMNRQKGLALPDGYEEYRFLLLHPVTLDRTEEYVLMSKQCPVLTSPYQVITYFLMRCFGKDFGAARFLTKNYVRTNLFPEHKMATLFRNVIDPAPDPDSGSNTDYHATGSDGDFDTFQTHTSYLCESLIEYDQEFYLVVTQVTLDHLRVVRFEKISSFRISTAEASMMLSRPEYVTVFDWYEGAPPFTRNSTELSSRSMICPHENGQLFMIFYPHNNHVSRRIYLLNDDVLGNYYASDSGQLILTSYTADGIRMLENDFIAAGLASCAVLAAKYQFDEPVLEEFISSGFDDFTDFAAFISTDADGGDE